MNTITREQTEKLEQLCAAYAADNDLEFDFYNITTCSAEGDGPEPWETAYSVLFEVYDFDNKHDFDWIEKMLHEAGISIDRNALGEKPYTDIITGDGELQLRYTCTNCRIYGYQLAVKK